MEAAIRTVKEIVDPKDTGLVELNSLQDVDENIKEANIKIGDLEGCVAVVHGAVNFPKMLDMIRANPNKYLFVEFMACTGGCINGGGQPIVPAYLQERINVKKLRSKALHKIDAFMDIRKSHKNQEVKNLYQEFLKKPGSEVSHHLLHTDYTKRDIYTK